MIKNIHHAIIVILAGLFIFISLSGFVKHIRCITFPYPLEYREGVVAYWVKCFVEHRPLYPEIGEQPPYMHNPYTPLYYILTGYLQKNLPESRVFLAGRMVSFLSLIIICFLIFKVVRHYGSMIAGLIAAGIFFCSPVSINYGSLEVVDMLALCWTIAGLYSAIKKTKAGFILSGLFCALAFLTKPTFVLASTGIIISLIMSGEKKKYFLSPFLGIIFFCFIYLFLKYRDSVFTHLLILNTLPFSFSHFFNVFSQVGIRHSLLFVFLAMFIGSMKDKNSPFYWYCVLSPITLLFAAKIGAEANYFLEIIALSSISLGIFFEKIQFISKQAILLTLVSQLFLFLPFKPAPVFTKTYGQEMPAAIGSDPSSTLKEAGELIAGELLSVSEPILSEDTGWLVVAGKDVIIEPYQFSQLAKYGRWNENFIVEMLREKQFNLILLNSESYEKQSEKFTQNMLEAIRNNYQVKRIIGNIYILEPMFWTG
ncbi:MAG: glycosyltransferase family 39 protein [bacterium]|nr:glycosyltransferase family 39 protein [bacterium]